MSSKKGGNILKNYTSVIHPIGSYLGHLASGREEEWKRTTLGRWFQSPSAKTPDIKKGKSAQAVVDAASESAMMAAKEKERKRLRGAAGRRSLIATSGRGLTEEAPTKKKRLLGE